ncbi:hypothetical protein SAMN05660443_0648 [Marinospirillum celere]|uniref:AAA domain (Dynein-related subfamily) n=1 Tax=Marinospirillum celere TaxID=1122252 RepID=A0A1I1EJH0_9GAMM|nr:hypothetical protein [Marinospirillum celere]SFB87254.1 hypothetical protein SAMN05660443_0648 [Marinospirillum celere]
MTKTATIDQVQEMLSHQLELLWNQPQLAAYLPPLMLWGAPGVGKSSVIREICRAQGIGFVDVRLAQREPVDLRGLPVPDGDQVRWLLSSEWPRDPQSRGIILFDELTAADRTLQVAAYEFILDRRLGDLYSVPDGWLICAAGNRSEDRAVAMTLSSALANRFCHLELQPELEQWARWARQEGLHPQVVSFLRFRPQCFFDMKGNLERGWPSPRTWARVATLLEHSEGLSETGLALMVQGLVGEGAGLEFLGFRRWATALPDIPAVLDGEAECKIPQRADQKYALCSGLAHYLWRTPEENQARRCKFFLRVGAQLTSDFATLAMMDAMEADNEEDQLKRAELLMSSSEFSAWSARHGEVLAQMQSRFLDRSAREAEPIETAELDIDNALCIRRAIS